ncbi:DUF4405 domain-containing protein [Arcobacter sp. YIC-464]|uniref:DUF4405 domain-containing protein n=1 Tax=Arcobacter sp. YIC-464 TaxID=3376631 RepID=UPI003C22FCF2
MSLKKITSLTMLFAMLVMTYTGIILFITPPGRIANWSNWEIFGLTKEEYAQIHTTFMVLFVVATLLHVYYNFRPMISYMKNKSREFVFFTKDTIVALGVSIVFLIGTLTQSIPFSSFLDFGTQIKDSWEKEYGSAPYSHAELSSLKTFTEKLGFDLEKSKKLLSSNGIVFTQEQSLSQIAQANDISPKFIYDLLRVNFEKEGQKIIPLTGLGKKNIEEVASTLGISTQEFIKQLETLGVKANANDKFKTVAEEQNLSVMNILEQLGYKKPE